MRYIYQVVVHYAVVRQYVALPKLTNACYVSSAVNEAVSITRATSPLSACYSNSSSCYARASPASSCANYPLQSFSAADNSAAAVASDARNSLHRAASASSYCCVEAACLAAVEASDVAVSARTRH